jgi:schlafen family protein
MIHDLYKADLSRISQQDLYESVAAFTRVDQPLSSRPHEGYLLDFKEDSGVRTLRNVASFANTFGGLVLLGVENDQGYPGNLKGMEFAAELKTHIASFIASNIMPCPFFEIADCRLPNDPKRKLCVVRVQEGSEVHLITKKGETQFVYVRVEDQSCPATPSQLRTLIEKRQRSPQSVARPNEILVNLQDQLYIRRPPKPGMQPTPGADPNLIILLFPSSPANLHLDTIVEHQFLNCLRYAYPELFRRKTGVFDEKRDRDWSEITYAQDDIGFERRWRFTSSGDVGVGSQIVRSDQGKGNSWSLCDIAIDVALMVTATKRFWESSGFLGRAHLWTWLNVPELSLLNTAQGFASSFYPEFSLPRSWITLAKQDRPNAVAELSVDYSSLGSDVHRTCAVILNQLLRSLGHKVHLGELTGHLETLFAQVESYSARNRT